MHIGPFEICESWAIYIDRTLGYMDHIFAMEINGQVGENGADDSDLYTKDGSKDLHGRPAIAAKTGRWKAAKYIIGNIGLNSLGFYGVTTNLVVYFTNVLHQGNATAANNVSTWTGTSSLFPIFGAFLGDAYWGRFWTTIIFSCIYLLGMGILTLSASAPSLKPQPCVENMASRSNCKQASLLQTTVFYLGLYVMSLGSVGYQPCLTALGADQFDEEDEDEKQQQSSFFNWFYLSIKVGALFASTLLVYLEQSIGWGLGFGICTGVAATSLLILLWGSLRYRLKRSGGNPIRRVLQVIVAATRKWKLEVPKDHMDGNDTINPIDNINRSGDTNGNRLYEVLERESAIKGSRKVAHTKAFRFLDKAATETEGEREMRRRGEAICSWRLCTVTQVEEVKFVLRVFPVWVTSILFSTVYVQMSTLFVEQGALMNTRVAGGVLAIPAAAVSIFDTVSVILWVPIYDRIIVHVASKWTGHPRGLTSLQRIGVGLAVSILSMVAAAIVEVTRLRLAREEGVVATGQPVTGMSVFWQVPQYAVVGAAEVFTYIGQMELFYDEAPDAVRSLSGAFVGLGAALGSYLSAVLVTLVSRFTRHAGAWIPQDNLNLGHLDRFFWLLAGISAVNLFLFVWFARRYQYTAHVA